MKWIQIVADEHIPFLRGALEPFARVDYLPAACINNRAVQDADALIIRTRTCCNRQLLEGSRVKFIASATIGHDHIDKEFCRENGIAWANAPGCNAASVQQYMLAAILQLAADFRWDLKERTIGIVGVGNVGKKVEKTARMLGMKVLLNDPPRAEAEGNGDFVDLDFLLQHSDIVSLHVPLEHSGKHKTHHMVDKAFLAAMKIRAWFVNTSRGEVAETETLKRVLKEKLIAGAILDVWEHEPDIDRGLLNLCYIGTPHIAGYSVDGKANGTAMAVNAVAAFFKIPLCNWYPSNLPEPVRKITVFDKVNLSETEILHQLVKRTYDIMKDSSRLKNSPADFEDFRNHYPVRREFGAYEIPKPVHPYALFDTLAKLSFILSE